MKLQGHIIKKYNTLFEEVAGHYGIENIVSGTDNLSVIYVNRLGFTEKVNGPDSCSKLLIHLGNSYRYLVPFYRFYLSQVSFTNIGFQYEYFENINKVIKKIRKEKSDVNI